MKEELKNFLIENSENYWSGCSPDRMCALIDEFFASQSKYKDFPKDHIWCGCPQCGDCYCIKCMELD